MRHLLLPGLILLATATAQAGELQTYLLHCSGCHARDGHSVPSQGIPDLHEAWLYADTPAGRRYLVQVPGLAASRLNDADAAAMLNWVLATFSDDHLPQFQPFSEAEVSTARDGLETNAEATRIALKAQHGQTDVR